MKQWQVQVSRFGTQLWGNTQGREARASVDRELADRGEVVVNLDLSDVEVIDVSFSREALATLAHQHRGHRWFFLSGIGNANVRENVDAAFAKLGLPVLHRIGDDEYEILGAALKPHLLQTLDVIEQRGRTTAREVCESIKDLSLTACNNRLKDLHDMGLVIRIEGSAPSGGKEYEYRALA